MDVMDFDPLKGDDAVERAYRVLGVAPGASAACVDAAYLGLVNRFNPQNGTDLGAEFTLLAVRKLAEVTAAFATVRHAAPARA